MRPRGDEARDHDQLAAAFLDLAVSPGDSLPRLLAVEEPLLGSRPVAVADPVGGVVAGERAGRREEDDERQAEVWPEDASTPAVMTEVSLGTIGMSASRKASRKRIA